MKELELLGKTVKDATTGYTGIVNCIIHKVTGNYQAGIQPKCNESGAYPDMMWIDTCIVDVVDDGISDRVTPFVTISDLTFGDEVEDKITGLRGIIGEKLYSMNGCEMYYVHRPLRKKDSAMFADWFSVVRLNLITKQKANLAVQLSTTAPGGPSLRVSSKNSTRF